MRVNAVDDVRLGEVRLVNPCCFVVTGARSPRFLRAAAIFNVANAVVTLMCVATEVARYECPIHGRPALLKPADDA